MRWWLFCLNPIANRKEDLRLRDPSRDCKKVRHNMEILEYKDAQKENGIIA